MFNTRLENYSKELETRVEKSEIEKIQIKRSLRNAFIKGLSTLNTEALSAFENSKENLNERLDFQISKKYKKGQAQTLQEDPIKRDPKSRIRTNKTGIEKGNNKKWYNNIYYEETSADQGKDHLWQRTAFRDDGEGDLPSVKRKVLKFDL